MLADAATSKQGPLMMCSKVSRFFGGAEVLEPLQ